MKHMRRPTFSTRRVGAYLLQRRKRDGWVAEEGKLLKTAQVLHGAL